MTKIVALHSVRQNSAAYEVSRGVTGCGLSGWALNQLRISLDGKGEVTRAELEEMRDRAAFALEDIENAIKSFDKATGKSVTTVS